MMTTTTATRTYYYYSIMYVYNKILCTAVWRVRRLAGCCRLPLGHACCRRVCYCRPMVTLGGDQNERAYVLLYIILLLSYVASTYKRNLLCSRCTRFGRSSSRSLETGKIRQMCGRVYLTSTFLRLPFTVAN